MIKSRALLFILLAVSVVTVAYFLLGNKSAKKLANNLDTDNPNFQMDEANTIGQDLNPLTIESLRNGQYPGSDMTIEQTLNGSLSHNPYIASYKSEGLKIYALLTVPKTQKPQGGWPVVVFNHGYIPPGQYQTTEKYAAYVDGFAEGGFIVFKPDFRGHGNSEGEASGAYGSTAYTVDVLNAVASIKRFGRCQPQSDWHVGTFNGGTHNHEEYGS